jgi:hypothetical protein
MGAIHYFWAHLLFAPAKRISEKKKGEDSCVERVATPNQFLEVRIQSLLQKHRGFGWHPLQPASTMYPLFFKQIFEISQVVKYPLFHGIGLCSFQTIPLKHWLFVLLLLSSSRFTLFLADTVFVRQKL